MARLEIHLFGLFEIVLDGKLVTGFESSKVRALLAFLAAESHRPQPRDYLAGLLWPDWPQKSALSNLRSALADLRKNIGDREANPPYLITSRETVQFNLSSDCWIDVEAFGRSTTAGLALQEVMGLYRGGFLESFSLAGSPAFEDWARAKGEYYRRQALTALFRLAEAYESQGDLEKACAVARRQLELEPWREEAHRQLMRLLALSGQRAAALVQYAACRKVLAEDLGVEPAVETTRLYDQIRSGEIGLSAEGEAPAGAAQTDSVQGEKPPAAIVSHQRRHNLPSQLTSFIGRQAEVGQVKRLLQVHRLVTLTGSGGVGKTRLSIQVGEETLEHFVDGVWFVDLAPVTNPELVPQAMATALGVGANEDDLAEALVFALRSREALLVLDNCEHLLEAVASLSERLLLSCAQVKILASSRIPLGLAGEAIYRVPSLAYPEPSQVLNAEMLLEFPAARLLVERARLTLPEYQLTAQNRGALVRICQRLDGIPLALELAAARLNVLTAEQVADRLEDAFRLLSVGRRTALPRQQTLRAAIEWSYRLLKEKERLLLNRLSVFSAGFTLEGVEAICAGDGLEAGEILDLLAALVDQSMVNARRRQGEETSYSLLETVRQFAREKLSPEEKASLADRHCGYYLWLAEQAEPRLRNSERLTWTKKMNLESLNFQQALVWAFGEGNPHAGICIIVALALRLWMPFGQTAQTVYWVKEGNKRARNGLEIPPLTLIRLLNCGILFDLISARKFDIKSSIDEIVALCHQVGPQADAQLSLILGLELATYHLQKDNSTVQMDNRAAICQSIEQCLEVASRLSSVDVWFKAYLYDNISWWAYAFILEDYNLACQYALESWRYFQQAGDRWLVDHLFVFGRAAQAEKDYEKARQCFQEAFSVFREVDDLTGMMRSLICLADLELTPGGTNRAIHAARLMGAVEALIGFWSEKDSWKNEIADFWFPQTMHNLRCFLEPNELKAAWEEGASMSFEEVYRYVLENPVFQTRRASLPTGE